MSVFPHSSSATYFIFCVGQNLVIINAFRHSMQAHGVWVKPLLGMYKGAHEHSFIADMADYPYIAPWLDDEESILHIHDFNSRDCPKATLKYLKEGREEYIGRMICVTKHEAMQHSSWTFDFTYGNYFICSMVE